MPQVEAAPVLPTAAGIADQGQPFEVADGDTRLRGEDVVVSHDCGDRFTPERLPRQPVIANGRQQRPEGDVDRTRAQGRLERRGIAFEEFDGHRGMAGAERGEHRGKEDRADTGVAPHHQVPVARAESCPCRLDPVLKRVERFLRMLGEDPAGLGQRGRADAALQEREAEEILERRDVRAHARLREMELAGGGPESATLRDREEAPDP